MPKPPRLQLSKFGTRFSLIDYSGVAVGVGVGVSVGKTKVGVGEKVAVTTMTIGVLVGVGVIVGVEGAAVFALPLVMTTVRASPKVSPLSFVNFHTPLSVPPAEEEVKTTETSTTSPAPTALPMAVALPPKLSPETKVN